MLFVPSALLKQAQIEFGLHELKDPICSWQTVDPVCVCVHQGRKREGMSKKERLGARRIFSPFVFVCHMTFDESDWILDRRLHG